MHHKYYGRKDISVLVVDKAANPSLTLAKHDVFPIAYFLHVYGFNVDLVWSLREHKFNNFEEFKKESERVKNERYSHIEDNSTRRFLEQYLPTYELLRKTPIDSIDDLADYNFIIAHPDWDDARIIDSFMKKYPNIPIILPIFNALIEGEQIIPNVFKDFDGSYIVVNEHEYIDDDLFLELIKYLLDKEIEKPVIPNKS